jgi:hypothetical protein
MISESQRRVQEYLESASLYHIKAAHELKEGHYEKAAENAILAQKHLDLASERERTEKHYETL